MSKDPFPQHSWKQKKSMNERILISQPDNSQRLQSQRLHGGFCGRCGYKVDDRSRTDSQESQSINTQYYIQTKLSGYKEQQCKRHHKAIRKVWDYHTGKQIPRLIQKLKNMSMESIAFHLRMLNENFEKITINALKLQKRYDLV